MIQAHFFKDGSLVAHNIRVNSDVSPMKFSAWFNAEGALTDCEAFDKLNRSRPVSPRVRKILASMYGHCHLAARMAAAK